MPNGRNNGDDPSRLDRLEGLVEVLVNRHIDFEDEHKRLLTAQVVLTDRLDRMAEDEAEFRAEMRHRHKLADERLSRIEEMTRENAELIRRTEERQKKTDEQLKKTDEQLKRTDEQLKRTDAQLQRTDKRVNALTTSVALIYRHTRKRS